MLFRSDADLLGVTVPRGFPVDIRPGRGWLVDHGTLTLVQVAVHTATTTAGDVSGDGDRRVTTEVHR